MEVDVPRRRMMYGLAGAVGALASASVFSFARNKIDDVASGIGRFLRDAGEARLLRPPDFAVKEFCTTGLDSLNFWYQNFWEFDELPDGLVKLEAAAAAAQSKKLYQDEAHRLMMLPAVGRLHALAGATPTAAEEHSALVCKVHRAALDAGSPTASREILEAIWQNATATLIRNETAWEYAVFDADLVSEAHRVLLTHLEDDQYLLIAALSAWQFLLTYEKALQGRENTRLLPEVRYIINGIADHPVGRYSFWLRKLQELLAKRESLDTAAPQVNEVLMSPGRAGLASQELYSFFAAAQLEQVHLWTKAQAGDLDTPYQWPNLIGNHMQSFLVGYGFRAEHLARFRSFEFKNDPRLGPTRKSLEHWAHQIGRMPDEAAAAGQYAGSRDELSSILPFNRVEAHRIVRDAYPRALRLSEVSDMMANEVLDGSVPKLISRVADNFAKVLTPKLPVLKGMQPEKATEHTLRFLGESAVEQSVVDMQRQFLELHRDDRTTVGVILPPLQQPDVDRHAAIREEKRVSKFKDPRGFDQAATAVFKAIPNEEREEHGTELVFINPFADKSKGKLYVFGKTLQDVLLAASAHFGTDLPGELMSLATEDGSIPIDQAKTMRLL